MHGLDLGLRSERAVLLEEPRGRAGEPTQVKNSSRTSILTQAAPLHPSRSQAKLAGRKCPAQASCEPQPLPRPRPWACPSLFLPRQAPGGRLRQEKRRQTENRKGGSRWESLPELRGKGDNGGESGEGERGAGGKGMCAPPFTHQPLPLPLDFTAPGYSLQLLSAPPAPPGCRARSAHLFPSMAAPQPSTFLESLHLP